MPGTDVSPVLSMTDLFQHVEALQPRIAVFDCDGTLWSGDAGSGFMWWSMDNGVLTPERAEWLRRRYEQYRRGEVSELAICGEMVQVYAGLPERALREAAATFFSEQMEEKIFPELRTLVETLLRAEVQLWAVSSTNHWIIEEGMRRFGIASGQILAAQVTSRDGILTEELVDVPTDEGKVASLRRVGVTRPDAVFGNSIHDAAMLAFARQAFAVNPTPGLLERSAQEGWPVYHPVPASGS